MANEWVEVAKLSEVPDGGTCPIRYNGEPICLYNLEGKIYATHDICTHGQASLADGFIVDGDKIECPLHQGMFNIATGKAVSAPCKLDLAVFEVKVEKGAILLKV
jgi:nitrite reductase/ring-hydroxylating ferredoxin subunit